MTETLGRDAKIATKCLDQHGLGDDFYACMMQGYADANDQKRMTLARDCLQKNDNNKDIFVCLAQGIGIVEGNPETNAALYCSATQKNVAGFRDCMIDNIAAARLSRDELAALTCVQKYGLDPQAVVCTAVGAMIRSMNPESQTTATCVAKYGFSKVAAACAAARLTADEFEKCQRGIGTSNGCFGPNNSIRRHLEDQINAARREANVGTAAIRATTGVSLRDIERRGILGGDNSEFRKACNFLFGRC